MKVMKKILSIIVSATLMFTVLTSSAYIPIQPAYATQTKTANFSKAYTLSGNNADDIVAVAKAQLNKTGSDLGYSEQWCADFTNDCAKLANIPSNVIPHEYASRGACTYMYSYMINHCNAKVVSTPQKGDIVFFDWSGSKNVNNLHHVAIVTGYSNNTISIIGGNQGSSGSLYSRKVSTASYSISNADVAKIVRPNYNSAPKEPSTPQGNDPEGFLDAAVGGNGTVTVSGWCLDRDTPNEAVEVHIYMDGPAGTGTCIATGIMADQPRTDVNNATGISGDHGFSATIAVSVSGEHTFYAHGINRGAGSVNTQLENGIKTTIGEKSSGIITSVSVSELTASGYTVIIGVSDESKVGRVAVPVWTQGSASNDTDAQDDLNPNWAADCIADRVGAGTYKYYVSTSDHNNESGRYCNDVYIFDKSGNIADKWCIETGHRTYADVPASVISSVSIDELTASGYTVNITVTDPSKVGRIAVPVWTQGSAKTDPEAQDDLIGGWDFTCIATKSGSNTYKYYVSKTDHKNESGKYCNDVYVYDPDGTMIDRWCIETKHRTYATVPTSIIKSVSISNLTYTGYDVNIAVADESKVGRIAVPVWSQGKAKTDPEAQDDLDPNWAAACIAKRVSTGTYQYHVSTSDHNKEIGKYCNDVYVFDKSGNIVDRWCIETNHRTYANVPSAPKATTAVTTTTGTTSTTTTTTTTATTVTVPLSISESNIVLVYGEQYAIQANQDNLTYTSDNSDVAIVSTKGIITAMGEGNAVISVMNSRSEVVQLKVTVIPTTVKGDCNGDGVFSVADVILLQKWLLAVPNTELADWKAADFCADGRLNVVDLCLMKKALLS